MLSKTGHRMPTFNLALELIPPLGNIVETGTMRIPENWIGDGFSTWIFAEFIKENSGQFWTCDIEPEPIEFAKQYLKDYSTINYVVDDSVHFLKNFNRPIHLLYLDSLDFDISKPDQQKISQQHVFNEYEAAKDKLEHNSIILIDDCKLINGGKGGMLIPHLLDNGWKIKLDVYQTLLVRK